MLTDRDSALRLIFELLSQVIDNRNFFIALYDAASHSLSFPIYTIQGELGPISGRPFGNGVTERVIRTRSAVLIEQEAAGTLARLGITSMGAFTEVELMHIRRGALLHDIGKMGIPDRILLKPGPLTEDEWVIMRQHPVYAYELLSPVAYLRPALDIPYAHHER